MTPLVTHSQRDLPPGASGKWCRLRVDVPGSATWWARVTFTDPARNQVVRSVFLGRERKTQAGGRRETLLHIPFGSTAVSLQLYQPSWNDTKAKPGSSSLLKKRTKKLLLVSGITRAGRLAALLRATGKSFLVLFFKRELLPPSPVAQSPTLSLRILPRWQTAIRLAWIGRGEIAFCLRGSPHGLAGRLRAVLGQAPSRQGEAPPYNVWIATCESRLDPPPPAPPLDIQVVIAGGTDSEFADSVRALAAQTTPSPHPPLHVTCRLDWTRIAAYWIVILGPGEILSPAALAWFAAAAADSPAADCIVADFDHLAAAGERNDPVFLPGAGKLVLQSGLPAMGPCAIRSPSPCDHGGTDAGSVRLAWMLQNKEYTVHVARILAHVPASAPPFRAVSSSRTRHEAFSPQVTALVPSRAASMRVANCLQRVDTHTDYRDFRISLLLSAPDHARARVLRAVERLSRVEVCRLPMQSFNYAAVNNRGATLAQHADYLLLLNDDVAPVNADWLDRMLAHMEDPGVGIVGARLLYGNGMVQHEGVIMGLADLCEHAGRLRRPNDCGIHGMGLMTREVSAVTAACMLVRACAYRDLGGLDEGFAIALNDVDFCLRAGQAGWRIVYCAEAQLLHYESLSLGRHYAGGRAALESVEVLRLRQRWPTAISDDRCYNPQASLEPGREWQPAFCPRPVSPYRRYT